jgi:hypothetical protein
MAKLDDPVCLAGLKPARTGLRRCRSPSAGDRERGRVPSFQRQQLRHRD